MTHTTTAKTKPTKAPKKTELRRGDFVVLSPKSTKFLNSLGFDSKSLIADREKVRDYLFAKAAESDITVVDMLLQQPAIGVKTVRNIMKWLDWEDQLFKDTGFQVKKTGQDQRSPWSGIGLTEDEREAIEARYTEWREQQPTGARNGRAWFLGRVISSYLNWSSCAS